MQQLPKKGGCSWGRKRSERRFSRGRGSMGGREVPHLGRQLVAMLAKGQQVRAYTGRLKVRCSRVRERRKGVARPSGTACSDARQRAAAAGLCRAAENDRRRGQEEEWRCSSCKMRGGGWCSRRAGWPGGGGWQRAAAESLCRRAAQGERQQAEEEGRCKQEAGTAWWQVSQGVSGGPMPVGSR